MAELRKAAFFRVEGTLVRRPALATAAWFTLNTQQVATRLTRLGGVALAAGLRWVGPFRDQDLVHRVTWMGLREMSRDRLEVLGEDYYREHVEPALLDVGQDLMADARKQGHRIVLLSENLGVVVEHLARHLRADALVCNRLEMRDDRATGRLCEPVVGGSLSGQWARGYARQEALDLEASCAYGARAADSLFLSAVGRPCAVNPDRRLRGIARDHDWPIVEG